MFRPKSVFFTPGRIIALSLLTAISIGTLLLLLPCAQVRSVPLIDIFFIATSATSGTGLGPVPLESFTLFGQSVILALIQIGGLSLITFTVFLISFFMELGLATVFLTGQVLEISSSRSMRRFITFIIGFTFCAELIGTVLTWYSLPPDYHPPRPLFYALFNAVTSFCNCGLTFFPFDAEMFRTSPAVLLTTSFLALIGGTGFISLREIVGYLYSLYSYKRAHLSLYTRVNIAVTFFIVLIGCSILWLLEYKTFFTMPPLTKFSNIFFDIVCARSTGLSTLYMPSIQYATLFLFIIISFIGSSPGSTGGGIKTTTLAIFLAAIRSVVSGRHAIEMKERSIPRDQVFKAMAIFSLSLTWVSIGLFILLVTETGWGFSDIMFEAFSAFANMGLSTGITPHLSTLGKVTIILLMIIGRIGSLTLIIALKRRQETVDFRYPEERVVLG